MRTLLLLCFLLTASLGLTAQVDSMLRSITSLDLYYGNRAFFGNFYKQLNTTSKYHFSSPVQTIGLGISGNFLLTRGGNFYGHFIYNQILPQTIVIQDSLKGKLNGFVFSFAYGGAYQKAESNFALLFYLGFNTGRLKITGNPQLQEKNPFFAPKVGVQPKIRFGKMALSLIAEYDYDVSKPSWRRTLSAKGDQVTMAKFRQTGLTGHIGIGYVFD